MSSRQIVIDSREQRPYDFDNAIRAALPAGDYSLEGLETTIAIERKSVSDLINTLLRARSRFSRELRKLQTYQFAAVVVETSISDILSGQYKSEITPAALLGIIVAVQLEYFPVQFVFCGDRPHAFAYVAEVLALAQKKWASTTDQAGVQ